MAETRIDFSFNARGKTYEDPGAGLVDYAGQLQQGFAVSAAKMPAVMRRYLTKVVDDLSRKHGNKWPAGTGSDSLSSRSGDLLRSLREGIRVAGTTLANTTGAISGIDYLMAHEYGASLTPRGARYLAIPLPAALKSDGTPLKDSPRDWEDTFVQESRRGNLLIFQRVGAGIIPLYAL